MAKVIINGDDFGLSPGVNRGIIHLFQNGILTSTTLMVNQPATEQAIDFALRHPRLGVGVHLNLSTGRPLLPSERVRSLVGRGGKFLPRSRLILGVFTGRVKQEEIRDELAAQIDFCTRARLQLSHLDSHCHIHAMPIIGPIVAHLGRRHGITRIRTPRLAAPLVPYIVKRGGFLVNKIGFCGMRSRKRQGNLTGQAISASWKSFETTSYLVHLGWWIRDTFPEDLYRTLATLGDCPIEIASHPGFVDEELAALSNYVDRREDEVRLLSDPQFRTMLNELGLVLSNFGDL